MADAFSFEIAARCGAARRGVIRTPHGEIQTPAFMPVGTRATVKSLTPAQIRETGTHIVLANTYHLLLRPGAETVAALGGLQKMMGWDRPVLTDSGGFQVFSLADLREVDDDGVSFRSHIDGALVRLTPEESIRVQNLLGADIIMAFDECPALGGAEVDPKVQHEAVRRTLAWAARSKAAHAHPGQALYGIVQGGLSLDLRQGCLDELLKIGFDGYALGGLSVGEAPQQMHAFVTQFADRLPLDKPRYLMGVGTPLDLSIAVAAGIDQFDCVLPTRNGRKGYAFTSGGVLRLKNAEHRLSTGPVDPDCDCYCCRAFSRGYLRHLFMTEETLGGTLLSLHNIAFFQKLMRQMRDAISAGTLDAWRREFEQSPVCRAKGELND